MANEYQLSFTGAEIDEKLTNVDKALLKTGGTMTGYLTLKGDPTSALHAATKQYVDNLLGDIETVLASL